LASYTVIAGTGIDGGDAVVGWIEFPEQDDLRLTSRIVGAGPDDVEMDMEVEVQFEQHDDVFLPTFRPSRTGRSRTTEERA